MSRQPSAGTENGEGEAFALPLRASRAILGLVCLAVGVAYTALAYVDLDPGTFSQPGAAMFPLLVGPLLAVAGLAVALERLAPEWGETYSIPAGRDGRRLLLLLLFIAAYIVLLPVLGNLIGGALLAFAVMWLLSPKPSLLRCALYAAVMSGLAQLVFVRLLQVQMPRGVIFTF